MKQRVDKMHFSRILKHVESHNKAKEEQVMWLEKKMEGRHKRRFSEESLEKYNSKKLPKVELFQPEEDKITEEIGDANLSQDVKWGHGGYWELYPELKQYKREDSSSSCESEKLEKILKQKKVKKQKKSKRKIKSKKNTKLKKKQETLTDISSESDFKSD